MSYGEQTTDITSTDMASERLDRIRRHRNIVLVGLMGAGKTTVGRRLAKLLDWRFVDSDDEIEKAADCTIAEIFERFGESEFRAGEARVIARLMQDERQVIATGGGAFVNPDSRAAIARGGVSVWLNAGLDLLTARTSKTQHRPLLHGVKDRRTVLTRLLDERRPFYAEADVTVDSLDGPPDVTVHRVIEAIAKL